MGLDGTFSTFTDRFNSAEAPDWGLENPGHPISHLRAQRFEVPPLPID